MSILAHQLGLPGDYAKQIRCAALQRHARCAVQAVSEIEAQVSSLKARRHPIAMIFYPGVAKTFLNLAAQHAKAYGRDPLHFGSWRFLRRYCWHICNAQTLGIFLFLPATRLAKIRPLALVTLFAPAGFLAAEILTAILRLALMQPRHSSHFHRPFVGEKNYGKHYEHFADTAKKEREASLPLFLG